MPEVLPTSSFELGALVTGLGGGLALFLFGMRQMTESLKTVAGSSMKNLLARLTANRFTAVLAGTIVTAVIQSSSVTTVLVVGFISAGLLNLSQSIGVIIGANIGTTITAQIIAFQIYKYGLLMITVGFLADIVAANEKVKQWGMALMGLGLIFFGMELMSNATIPMQRWPPFLNMLQQLQHPLLAIAIGLIFTAIVQSSSATTGIVIVLASQGLISLESGIGLCFGANIGTCVTVVISALGRSREAIQAAWIHVLFNVAGVVLWMFFIAQFAELIRSVSPVSIGLEASERIAADTPRQIANAHTIFNVGNALLFIWFTGPLAKLADWLVPKRTEPIGIQARYLDELFLEQPALALDHVRLELVRLAEMNRVMLQRTLSVVSRGSPQEVQELKRDDDDVDALYSLIVLYLRNLAQKNLVNPLPQQLSSYISIANYLENIGDVIENDLLADARKRMARGVLMSSTTVEVLRPVHERILWALDRVVDALRDKDLVAAKEAVESKAVVNGLAEKATTHLAQRLASADPNRVAAFQVETGLLENLRRINNLTRRIAKALLTIDNGISKAEPSSELGNKESENGESLAT